MAERIVRDLATGETWREPVPHGELDSLPGRAPPRDEMAEFAAAIDQVRMAAEDPEADALGLLRQLCDALNGRVRPARVPGRPVQA